jgi:hypothetical protein
MKRLVTLLTVSLIAITTSGCWETSSGERVGIVTKLSCEGIFWKTWEGKLHFAGANGTIAADWSGFSLDASMHRGEDIEALSKRLVEAQCSGKRVKIIYREEMLVAPWRANTYCLVQAVEFVD